MDDHITDQPPQPWDGITDQPADSEPRERPGEFRYDPDRCLAKLPSRRTLVEWLWQHSLLGAVAGAVAGWYVSSGPEELSLALLLGLLLGAVLGLFCGLICWAIANYPDSTA